MKKKPLKETQNDRELKLLRMILANVFRIETKNWESTEHRAFAIGRLEGMIELKELIKKYAPKKYKNNQIKHRSRRRKTLYCYE